MDDHSDTNPGLVSLFRWGYHGAPLRADRKQSGSKSTPHPFAHSNLIGPDRTGNLAGGRISPGEASQAGKGLETLPATTHKHLDATSILGNKETGAPQPVEPARSPQASRHAPADGLDHWVQAVKACQACGLGHTRHVPVCGSGTNHPEVLILGSIPGYEEDQVGVPFVSGSGQYLDKWLEAIGLDRYKTCYLSYLLHCHGQLDQGTPANLLACRPHLDRLIAILGPKVILTVGKTSADWLLGTDTGSPDNTLRDYQGIPVLVTHEPGDVLRDPGLKRQVWDVLRLLKARFLA